MPGFVARDELVQALNSQLHPQLFQDYAPNGLQIEGSDQIQKIALAVTASQAAINQAVVAGADTMLVHHGYFWRGESEVLCGYKGRRIKALMKNDMNLIAYHLPLDAHRVYGNNVQLGERLEIENMRVINKGALEPLGVKNTHLCFYGEKQPVSIEDFSALVMQCLGREPLVISGAPKRMISRVAWCTGGAQDYLSQAIAVGADVFITGEVSERTYHEAKESGVHFIAAGHHATERYGVQALGSWLQSKYNLETLYIEINNPV